MLVSILALPLSQNQLGDSSSWQVAWKSTCVSKLISTSFDLQLTLLAIDTAINSSVAHPVARNAALKSRADEDEEAEALLEWDFDESDYVVSRIS